MIISICIVVSIFFAPGQMLEVAVLKFLIIDILRNINTPGVVFYGKQNGKQITTRISLYLFLIF